jgi:hypothetical protein
MTAMAYLHLPTWAQATTKNRWYPEFPLTIFHIKFPRCGYGFKVLGWDLSLVGALTEFSGSFSLLFCVGFFVVWTKIFFFFFHIALEFFIEYHIFLLFAHAT